MYTFTYSAEAYDESNLDKKKILTLILKHQKEAERILNNLDYYLGKHAIDKRAKKENLANNKIMVNHARDISDTATGYFLASPITYATSDESKKDLDKLTDAFDQANTDDVDHDNALDMSRCGVAYEYVYVKENESILACRNLEPMNTFLVYDDTIEQNPLFGVYYYLSKDDTTDKGKYIATVCTKNYIYRFVILNDAAASQPPNEAPEDHFLGDIPIIEYRNNKDCIGDFEQQKSLIDAYNTLMSDRINDKEQFLEALLVIYGAVLGDDEKETKKAAKELKDSGILELPDTNAKAEYITRQFDEAGVEILKKAFKDDIYTMSHVPNLTDENFVGNSSGVAMEYKLLGLEMITRTKERYYTKGLKQRIKLFCNYLNIKALSLNPAAIMPNYSRGLPKNMLELSQMIVNLKGTVSAKTLISQLDFVEDPDGELEEVKKENEESAKLQQSIFANNENIPPKESEDENDEETKDSASVDKAAKQNS